MSLAAPAETRAGSIPPAREQLSCRRSWEGSKPRKERCPVTLRGAGRHGKPLKNERGERRQLHSFVGLNPNKSSAQDIQLPEWFARYTTSIAQWLARLTLSDSLCANKIFVLISRLGRILRETTARIGGPLQDSRGRCGLAWSGSQGGSRCGSQRATAQVAVAQRLSAAWLVPGALPMAPPGSA